MWMVFNCVNLLVGHFQSEKRNGGGGQAFLQDLSLTGVQDVSGLSPDVCLSWVLPQSIHFCKVLILGSENSVRGQRTTR